MTLIARLTLVVMASLSLSAFAATPANCDDFVKAFEKAAKKPMDAESKAFWKKSCLKDTDESVKKTTACFNNAKTDADANKCMK